MAAFFCCLCKDKTQLFENQREQKNNKNGKTDNVFMNKKIFFLITYHHFFFFSSEQLFEWKKFVFCVFQPKILIIK